MNAAVGQYAPLVISVRIFGLDGEGEPFSQQTTARNLGVDRALLEGIDHQLKLGEIIGLQYEGRKAKVRVMWVGEWQSQSTTQARVQLVAPQECPWLEALKSEVATAKPSPGEKRRNPRHRVSLGIEIHEASSGVKIQARTTDMSINGCYVETFLPLPLGAKLQIEMWAESEKIAAAAIVRTHDPGVGMGIEFLGLAPEQEQRLDQLFRSSLR